MALTAPLTHPRLADLESVTQALRSTFADSLEADGDQDPGDEEEEEEEEVEETSRSPPYHSSPTALSSSTLSPLHLLTTQVSTEETPPPPLSSKERKKGLRAIKRATQEQYPSTSKRNRTPSLSNMCQGGVGVQVAAALASSVGKTDGRLWAGGGRIVTTEGASVQVVSSAVELESLVVQEGRPFILIGSREGLCFFPPFLITLILPDPCCLLRLQEQARPTWRLSEQWVRLGQRSVLLFPLHLDNLLSFFKGLPLLTGRDKALICRLVGPTASSITLLLFAPPHFVSQLSCSSLLLLPCRFLLTSLRTADFVKLEASTSSQWKYLTASDCERKRQAAAEYSNSSLQQAVEYTAEMRYNPSLEPELSIADLPSHIQSLLLSTPMSGGITRSNRDETINLPNAKSFLEIPVINNLLRNGLEAACKTPVLCRVPFVSPRGMGSLLRLLVFFPLGTTQETIQKELEALRGEHGVVGCELEPKEGRTFVWYEEQVWHERGESKDGGFASFAVLMFGSRGRCVIASSFAPLECP
jgi:hypothetical protein